MKVSKKIINEYLKKPYSYIVNEVHDESGHYFIARILELDGLIGTGYTYSEAYMDAKESLETYIETKLANNVPIPEPIDACNYSGRFVLRLPKALHKFLSLKALEEGVSLNQYALYKLAM